MGHTRSKHFRLVAMATRALQSQPFEIGPIDAATYATGGVALMIVALAACWIPARRAARIDPAIAMRT